MWVIAHANNLWFLRIIDVQSEASLHFANKPEENRQHTFIADQNTLVSAIHAYNLLVGRAILREHTGPEGMKHSGWMQLDLTDKDAKGNYRIKEFQSAYGYDLHQVLKQLPLKELSAGDTAEKLVDSLTNGRRQQVTLQREGKEQKLFVEANPQSKSINIYDEQAKKLSLASVLGAKTVDMRQSMTSTRVNHDQAKKNGLSIR